MEGLSLFWGLFPGIRGASVEFVLGDDTADWMGGFQLDGDGECLVSGVGLVELGLVGPLCPDVHPAVCALAFEAVLDLPFARDPVACVVVAGGLLDPRALFDLLVGVGLCRCTWWERR